LSRQSVKTSSKLVDHDHHPLLGGVIGQGQRSGQMKRAGVVLQAVDRLLHAALVVEGEQRRRQRGQRMRPRTKHLQLPSLAAGLPAGAEGGHHARADQRRLSAARRTQHGEQSRGLEQLEQALDVPLSAEEELRVSLVEDLKPAVRAHVISRLDRHLGAERQSPDRMDEVLHGAAVIGSVPKVDPGPRPQERRQDVGIERVEPGEQDREDAEPALLRGAIQRDGHLEALPGAQVPWAHEDRARAADRQGRGQLLLPVAARREAPSVEPGFDAVRLEPHRDPFNRRPIRTGIGQEDVEAPVVDGYGVPADLPSSRWHGMIVLHARGPVKWSEAAGSWTVADCGRCRVGRVVGQALEASPAAGEPASRGLATGAGSLGMNDDAIPRAPRSPPRGRRRAGRGVPDGEQ
jgi:hypothetical protein